MGAARFSFEIFRREADGGLMVPSLGEYYFVNGPLFYQENFRYRVTVTPTFAGGAAVVDHGNGINVLKIKGEFHILHRGRPPTSGVDPDVLSVEGAQKYAKEIGRDRLADAFPIPGVNVRTGQVEFEDFVGLLYGIRSETDRYVSQEEQAIPLTAAFKEKRFNFAEFGLVWNDYDRGRSIEVVPPEDGFTITRSAEDTNTYIYEGSFNVVDERSPLERRMQSWLDIALSINPFYSLSRSVNFVKTVLRLPLRLTGALVTLSKLVERFTDTGNQLVNTWDAMREQFDSDGRLARKNFQASSENLKRTGSRQAGDDPDQLQDYARRIAGHNARFSLVADNRGVAAEFRAAVQEFERATDALYMGAIQTTITPEIPFDDYVQDPDVDLTPLIRSAIYEPLIMARRAIRDIRAELRRADADNSYRVHSAGGGDSWESLARAYMGEADLSGPLAAYNGQPVGTDSLQAGSLVRIPDDFRTLIIDVIEPPFTSDRLERGLLGTDLALTDQRDFAAGANGDLATTSGLATLANNLVDVIDVPAGSLPFHYWYGNPISLGSVVRGFERRAQIQRLMASLRADPRVRSATLQEIAGDGNRVTFFIEILSIFNQATLRLRVLP